MPAINGGTPSPNRSIPCFYRGKVVSKEDCNCSQLFTYACEKHGKCCPGQKKDGVQFCQECPDYDADVPHPPEPEKRLTGLKTGHGAVVASFNEYSLAPGYPGKRFNSSMVKHGDGYLLSYRDGWEGSEIHLIRLNKDLAPASPPQKLNLFHPREANYGREDPRLFWHKGQLHVSYIGVVGGHAILHTSQLYARLNAMFQVEEVLYPHYPPRNSWEKNWGFFSHEDVLYASYSISPHRVLKINGPNSEMLYNTPTPFPWAGGELRGGTPPIPVGNEYWSFFHSRSEVRGHRIYDIGVYAFEAKPPFHITRVTPKYIAIADPSTKPADQYASVLFPCGAVLDGDRWLVAMGVHDRWTEIREFSHEQLQREMVSR